MGQFSATLSYIYPISIHYLSDIVPTIVGGFLRFSRPRFLQISQQKAVFSHNLSIKLHFLAKNTGKYR